ncbi:MAG: TIGR03960 family B12-binding radical SAM protein [Candidatus Zixiibacteriota bacterium]|nr:MAG: TIGR03960 family B12-binding radical SAM protein [candidate division Zixibacteria bacterium]
MKFKNSLRNEIERDLLPFVSKPARYIGSERNAVIKPHKEGILKLALCFPEMYEIGMSYLGMKILYNLINQREDCVAERAFMVWPDMEERMRELNIPLFSMESSTPLNEFDILGFHLTYEMNYTAIIAMLELSGIGIYSKDRSESDPIILAGGPSTINPEPAADFIDALYIGDAEEAIHEIIDSIRRSRDSRISRESILEKLTDIPGVYVPGFYKPIYTKSGKFDRIERLKPGIPEKIKIRSVPDLKDEYYPDRPIVPYIEISQDHLAVEIMRGCVRGCRFCQAGYQYRPRRQRDVQSVKSEIIGSLSATGYDDVTLLSLSSTDFDRLSELLEITCSILADRKVGLGLPSLRPETITPELLNYISTTRKPGLTIAPEAGTEKLRKALGKDITDEQIFAAVENAVNAGWQTIKFYFMIGLPGETAEDIEAIVSILRKASYMARQGGRRVNINVSISPFCPKSHTPWQWEELASKEDLEKKIEKISRRARKSNINLKFRDLDLTSIEAAISRGDRRIGEVIYNAYKKGSRLDGWSELFDVQRWQAAFDEAGLDISHYTGSIDEDSALPWDHIDKGISKEFLKKDNRDSKEGVPPETAFSRKSEATQATRHDDGFGRKAKRAAKPSALPKGTYRLRIRYSIGPELRFLSHLDNIRTVFRAIRRGEIPVAYSEGFNPHQKVSFGPPLPVGYTSEAEYFDMVLTEPFREEFLINLKRAFPEYIGVRGHKYYFAKPGSLVKQLNFARYEIPIPEGYKIERKKITALLNDKKVTVVRTREKVTREVEAGKFIENLELLGNTLYADISQTPDGHIKPDEILIFGLGFEPDAVKPLTIHRKSQFQKFGGRLIDPLDLV